MSKYLKYLFQLILSPGHGWEDIEKADIPPSQIASAGFYPLIALASASVFFNALYDEHTAFIKLFMEMVVTFAAYLVSYFFSTFMLSLFIEPMLDKKYDEDRCHTFVLYTLGLLALITIILNGLSIPFVQLFFLPFYVAIVQWKGADYMNIKPQQTGLFMILAILGVLAPKYMFEFLFNLIF